MKVMAVCFKLHVSIFHLSDSFSSGSSTLIRLTDNVPEEALENGASHGLQPSTWEMRMEFEASNSGLVQPGSPGHLEREPADLLLTLCI